MLKGIFLVFIGGWLTWFWIDKPPAAQFGLPPVSDSLLENFQRSIDMLKAGYPDMAYLYIWHAHYLILSVVFGILLAVLINTITDHLMRKSRRRHYYPLPGAGASAGGKSAPAEHPQAPSDDGKTSAHGGSGEPPMP